ncbi:MAG: tetratricopeptide repeat protein, partial [Planctomycetota bacterium]
ALYEESESLFESTLDARQRVLGDEHPDTLDSAHGLGMLYATTGRLGEAEQLLKQTLASRRRVLREKHPDIVDSIKGLTQLYWVWSKPQEVSQWQAELARLTDSQ